MRAKWLADDLIRLEIISTWCSFETFGCLVTNWQTWSEQAISRESEKHEWKLQIYACIHCILNVWMNLVSVTNWLVCAYIFTAGIPYGIRCENLPYIFDRYDVVCGVDRYSNCDNNLVSMCSLRCCCPELNDPKYYQGTISLSMIIFIIIFTHLWKINMKLHFDLEYSYSYTYTHTKYVYI